MCEWIGWFKLNDASPWEQVCTGETLDQCSKRLLDATRDRCTPASRRFMTHGSHPEDVFRRFEKQTPAPAVMHSGAETAGTPLSVASS
jgi:hypothetical protein